MQSTLESGKEGEDIAAAYLESKDYKILDKNFRSGHLELDIIAQQNECLVFVEVRLRKNAEFGYPEESMGKAKINAVKRAAEAYMRKCKWMGDVRFDFIAITQQPAFDLVHFEDAYF